MKAYILDYGGTLSRLPDPPLYINMLKQQGHYVILWSGGNSGAGDKETYEATQHACDWYSMKGMLDEILKGLSGHPNRTYSIAEEVGPLDEIVVSDDQLYDLENSAWCCNGIPLRFLDPSELANEVPGYYEAYNAKCEVLSQGFFKEVSSHPTPIQSKDFDDLHALLNGTYVYPKTSTPNPPKPKKHKPWKHGKKR